MLYTFYTIFLQQYNEDGSFVFYRKLNSEILFNKLQIILICVIHTNIVIRRPSVLLYNLSSAPFTLSLLVVTQILYIFHDMLILMQCSLVALIAKFLLSTCNNKYDAKCLYVDIRTNPFVLGYRSL